MHLGSACPASTCSLGPIYMLAAPNPAPTTLDLFLTSFPAFLCRGLTFPEASQPRAVNAAAAAAVIRQASKRANERTSERASPRVSSRYAPKLFLDAPLPRMQVSQLRLGEEGCNGTNRLVDAFVICAFISCAPRVVAKISSEMIALSAVLIKLSSSSA